MALEILRSTAVRNEVINFVNLELSVTPTTGNMTSISTDTGSNSSSSESQ